MLVREKLEKNGYTILNRGTNLSSVPDSYCELEPNTEIVCPAFSIRLLIF